MIVIFRVSVSTSGTSWLVGVTLHYIALIDPDFFFAEPLFKTSYHFSPLKDLMCVFSDGNRREEAVVDSGQIVPALQNFITLHWKIMRFYLMSQNLMTTLLLVLCVTTALTCRGMDSTKTPEGVLSYLPPRCLQLILQVL